MIINYLTNLFNTLPDNIHYMVIYGPIYFIMGLILIILLIPTLIIIFRKKGLYHDTPYF